MLSSLVDMVNTVTIRYGVDMVMVNTIASRQDSITSLQAIALVRYLSATVLSSAYRVQAGH